MTITLESSLNSLKIALAQHGTAGAVSATQTLTQGKLQSTTAGSGNTSATLSLTQSTVWRLDMQRQLDSAYRAQSMLEVAGNANADIMTRLKNLKKVTVQATNQTLAQSERAFLASQFEGIRKSLLSNVQSASWDGQRLFDGTAGSRRDGTLSFAVGSGSDASISITLPNLREEAVRMSGVRAIQGSLGPGTREQQTISLASANLAHQSGALTVGDLTLNAGTLGAGASVADLVTGLASDANYADAAFTLADNGSNGLAISWKSTGEIFGTARLQLMATAQTVTATRSVTGVSAADQPAVSEEQFISIADSDLSRAVSVMLNDGSGAQNSYGLGFSGGTTLSDLAAAINASYSSSMPFSVTAQSDGLRLLWSGGGNQSGLASLAVSSPDVTQTTYATSIYSASEVSSGAVAGTTEVQKLALSADDVRGKTLTLSANGVTLSSGAMSATATMADLVAALQSDTNYSNAGLEITEDTTNGVTSGLTLSWTSATAVSDFASMSVIDSLASSTFEATETTAGIHTSVADGTREVQQIAVRASAVAGRNVMLRAGNYTLFSGTLDSAASINQLADALKASPRYSAAPFTVSQDRPGYLTLTWKTPGTVSQLAALEVQPDAPLQSLLRRGGVGSAEAATSMSDAIDLAMQTMTSSSDILSFAGLQLTAAVQKLSSRQSSSGPITQHPGTAYVNAISSMLRSQISGNTSQATAAQANFTPQGVITTLQF